MSKDHSPVTNVGDNSEEEEEKEVNEAQYEKSNGLNERSALVYKSQLCEQAGRFEDMVKVMDELCTKYDDLTHDEKNLLSCAYKNVIGSRRTAWRMLNDYLDDVKAVKLLASNKSGQHQSQHNNNNNDADNQNASTNLNCQQIDQPKYSVAIVAEVLDRIKLELRDYCCNIIDILSNRLIPSSSAKGESRVFYHKMKGDYLRYLCEISCEEERKEKSNDSLLAYKTASDKAMIELPPTHPVRLSLMLNFSVFYYDIMKSPERSCKLAKQAFDDAIAELDTLSENSYRDSTIIMQLLRDNLKLWESEQNFNQTPAGNSTVISNNKEQ